MKILFSLASCAFWRRKPPPEPTEAALDRRQSPRDSDAPPPGDRYVMPDPANQKTPWVSFWRVFPALSIIPIGALVAYAYWMVDRQVEQVARAERFAVALQKDAVTLRLNEVAIHICALARQNELQTYVADGDVAAATGIAAEYLALVQNSNLYDQIRLLDSTGMELVRVNGNSGYPYVVGRTDLQDKSDRYYFEDTIAIEPNEIYISPLDLNVEFGEIEIPHNPVIRISTPIFDDEEEVNGIVVVNFLLNSMLERVVGSGTASAGDPFMLNAEGYWLVSSDPAKEWGFMFPDRFYQRMSVLYPDEWHEMIVQDHNQIRTENGLFTYDSYYPLADFGNCHDSTSFISRQYQEIGVHFYGEYRWILATHVSNEHLNRILRNAIITSVAIGVPLVFLLAAGTRSIGIIMAERHQHRAQLELVARFDPLTRLANRRTFEDHLQQEFLRAQRNERRFAVLYMDLDGFKAVNDGLGHAAGDAVLQDVAAILSRGCRAVDTPARLGGDEFVVLLSEVRDKPASRMVAERLLKQIRALDYEGYPIGASIGVAVWPDDGQDIKQIVQLADQTMYRAKKAGKNQVVVAAPADAPSPAPAAALQPA